MWVFGYGSLIWKVDFPYEKKLIGYIKGYDRRFYQHSIDHRGIPEKPGRVVTLITSKNKKATVWGVAYYIKTEDRSSVSSHLDFREKNGYEKATIMFYPKQSLDESIEPFELTIYLATPENASFAGEADIDEIARQIVHSSGPSGSNKDYVYNLATAMRLIAPKENDEHLFALEAAVKKLDNVCEQKL